MSHMATGFTVTDIGALSQVLAENCPQLEMVRESTFFTWAIERGRLAGDYALPAIYQLKLAAQLKQSGIDLHAVAKECGIKLPAALQDLETQPWTVTDQEALCQNPVFRKAYDTFVKTTVSRDAVYVIRNKDPKKHKTEYQIGVVANPVRSGEYVMLTDFYLQGRGLLTQAGVGRHVSKNGVDTWGGELKQAYAVCAAEREIKRQIQARNPAYGSYTKTTLPDGRVKLEVTARPF